MKYRQLFEDRQIPDHPAIHAAREIFASHWMKSRIGYGGRESHRSDVIYSGDDAASHVKGISDRLVEKGWQKSSNHQYHRFSHPDVDSHHVKLFRPPRRDDGGYYHSALSAAIEETPVKTPTIDTDLSVPKFTGQPLQYHYDPRDADQALAHDVTMDAVKAHNKANPDNQFSVLRAGRLGKGSPYAHLYDKGKYDHDKKQWVRPRGSLSNTTKIHNAHASYFKVYVRPKRRD